MEITTFDFGDVSLGTIEDDEATVNACGVVTFGRKAMLQLNESVIGHLDRLKNLEPGFVTFVGADGLGLTDADYKAVAAIPGLRSVDFDNTQITTDQIGYLCTSEVRALNLATESLTDDAMPAIASMPGLVHLFASRSSVSDVGVACLRGHGALEALHLAATNATVESAEVIASLPALATLELPSADDAVLIAAAREQTTWLHLQHGKVSEAGIRALWLCAELSWLGLVNR